MFLYIWFSGLFLKIGLKLGLGYVFVRFLKALNVLIYLEKTVKGSLFDGVVVG